MRVCVEREGSGDREVLALVKLHEERGIALNSPIASRKAPSADERPVATSRHKQLVN